MSAVRTDPFAGAILQVGVLAALAGTVGLSAYGWLAGLLFGVVTVAALGYGLRRSGADRLGPADWVTLTRATLTGGVAALTVESFRGPIAVPVLVALAAVALSLDWVDGQVARRTGTTSALGARFDMEVDSFLVLVLCGYVADQVGAWVLVIGAMRYVFVAAGWVLPWMRGSLPPRYWRKVVAATQGIALTVVAAGVLPRPLALAVVSARSRCWSSRSDATSAGCGGTAYGRRRGLPAAPVSPAPAGHGSEWTPGTRIVRQPVEVGGRRR